MKIILSRKGLDSASGGWPSPILPTGEMVSLPIPESVSLTERHRVRYRDLATAAGSAGVLAETLSRGKLKGEVFIHLDPDLDAGGRPRSKGWRPLFGQSDAAETHLRNESVGPGDLFLFFGWFRRTGAKGGGFERGAPNLHVLFGWLQVAERIDVHSGARPAWAVEHPHFLTKKPNPVDAVYVASERLTVPGLTTELPGAGIFQRFDPKLQLTAPDAKGNRSYWSLPRALADDQLRCRLSYHRQKVCETRPDGSLRVPTVGRGQEFVAPADGLTAWLAGLFSVA